MLLLLLPALALCFISREVASAFMTITSTLQMTHSKDSSRKLKNKIGKAQAFRMQIGPPILTRSAASEDGEGIDTFLAFVPLQLASLGDSQIPKLSSNESILFGI